MYHHKPQRAKALGLSSSCPSSSRTRWLIDYPEKLNLHFSPQLFFSRTTKYKSRSLKYTFCMMKINKLLAGLALPVLTSCWYLEVHNQIGYVADQLLSSRARWMVGQILEPEYNGSIGRAASWADTVSRSTAKYSYEWHWISAQDNPPQSCSLLYHRDCQERGCVVQQIANQTGILGTCLQRVKQGTYTPDINCQQALKWIIHFTEDVEQPMHTSGRALGGNLFNVTYGGKTTNMHQTWDRWILYTGTNKGPEGFNASEIDPYFASLLERIRDDAFDVPRDKWAVCNWDIGRGTYCPELWARDSNLLVCDYVYGKFVNDTTDLLGSGYAAGAFPVVELQLAKAAWRLAGWLNTVTTLVFGSSGHEDALPGITSKQELQRILANVEL